MLSYFDTESRLYIIYTIINLEKGIYINSITNKEEAMIYCNLGRTQLAKKCEECGVFKNSNGYYKRVELDMILSGAPSKIDELVRKIKL